MAQRITVNELMTAVRQQLNEDSTLSVSDLGDILPALNRAQNYALDILARHYKDPLLASTMIHAVAGQTLYDIPEDAFEMRLLKVEVKVGGNFSELTRIDYLDVALYENTQAMVSIPMYYNIIGNQFKVLPAASGTYNFRVWYLKDPLPLVSSQGRLNSVNELGNYVIIDEVGQDLSAVSDSLDSFVNIIDGATGATKGVLQIQSIQNNKITFKTVPTRATVLDVTVSTSLVGLGVQLDDYLCLSSGTCVPFLKKPFSNFLVQFAVAEIVRKLGGDAATEEQVLQKFEQQVERTWVQRPNPLRIQKRNATWAVPIRRTTTNR
jgi:hypothetical protein